MRHETPELTLVMLPGLDGTGRLFSPLVKQLPPTLSPLVVTYPPDRPLGYEQLLSLVLDTLPRDRAFVLLGESFSGPLAMMVASLAPAGLCAVVLAASFVRNPLPAAAGVIRRLVRGPCLRTGPERLRQWALLDRNATPALRRLVADTVASVPPGVLARRIRDVLGVDVRDLLVRCRVPILYLRASRDRLVGKRNVADVISGCPSAKIVTLPASHLVLQVQPAAAAAVIATFLATDVPHNQPLQWTGTGVGIVQAS